MSTSKHTPGPWFVVTNGDEYDGEVVIIGHPSWPCARNGVEGEWEVARLETFFGDYPEELEANADLIAAAPDLLSEAKAVIAQWDTPNWKLDEPTAAIINRLRAAVAKAERQS